MRTTRSRCKIALTAVFAALLAQSGTARAQIVRPPFDASYHLRDLGSVVDLPFSYGGMVFLAGDPDTLLIGGAANADAAALYSVGVVRGAGGHIVGFSGPAVFHSEAAFIDGGVTYGPGGVLFLSRYHNVANMAEIGQQKPGSAATDKVVDLSTAPLAIPNAPGGLTFVPSGLPGAGQLKLSSFGDGQWYNLDIAADGAGTFDVTATTPTVNVGACPEQSIYRASGTLGFPSDTLILAEWCAGIANAYAVDANGDPVPGSQQAFVDALPGAEGVAIDPTTGDILFSAFGDLNRVLVAYSHAPLPCVADADCDDSNVCTDDSCEIGTGNCNYVDHDSIACDDGLFCDGADMCLGGFCSQHAGNPCSALPNCQDFCFEGGDVCGNTPENFACTTPDDIACTQDICDGNGTCAHPSQPSGTPCEDDGSLCTEDVCSGYNCEHRGKPAVSCRQPFKAAKATLLIKDDADPKKDNLDWKWVSGSATDLAAFGDPIGATDWQLCVYDLVLANGTVRLRADVEHGGNCGTPTKPKPCWVAKGKPPKVKGYKFNDKSLLQQGTQTIDLTAGADGKAKVTFHGKGANLMPPGLPLNGRVVVQLRASNGECWGATYSTPTKNTTKLYKAKAD